MRIIITAKIRQPTLLQALRDVPSARIIFEQLDTVNGGNQKGSFWVESDDYDAFEAAMDDDPTVANVRRLATFNERHLYQAEQVGEAREKSVYPTLVDAGGILQRLVGTRDGWDYQIAFPDQDALTQFYDVCLEYDIGFTLLQKYEESSNGATTTEYGLSAKQRKIMVHATSNGYFEVPRKTELNTLADELEISHQAASERIRRATDALTRNTIYPPERIAEDD